MYAGLLTYQDTTHGQIVAQHDGFDAAPVTLQAGDVVLQRHLLPVFDLETAVPYTIFVGLYQRNSEQRLPITGVAGDRFSLATIIIDEK